MTRSQRRRRRFHPNFAHHHELPRPLAALSASHKPHRGMPHRNTLFVVMIARMRNSPPSQAIAANPLHRARASSASGTHTAAEHPSEMVRPLLRRMLPMASEAPAIQCPCHARWMCSSGHKPPEAQAPQNFPLTLSSAYDALSSINLPSPSILRHRPSHVPDDCCVLYRK